MADKWKHAIICRPCTGRYSTIQLIKGTRIIEFRVIVCEFIRAVSLTAQLAAVFPEGAEPQDLQYKDRFVRTVFGILGTKKKRTLRGYVLCIDLSSADRFKRSGATFFAEMIGICAIMTGGKAPTRMSVGDDGEETTTRTKAMMFNQSLITNERGSS